MIEGPVSWRCFELFRAAWAGKVWRFVQKDSKCAVLERKIQMDVLPGAN
jgi:hypothetical protein